MHALGLTDAQIRQPFVSVVTSWNETAPDNIALARQAQGVKRGVRDAGGTPREFTTIAGTGIANSGIAGTGGFAADETGKIPSLLPRDLIADSVETICRGSDYQVVVGIAGCDKAMAGMIMAMARCNLPSVVMFGEWHCLDDTKAVTLPFRMWRTDLVRMPLASSVPTISNL